MKRKNKNVAIMIPELGGGGAERIASILGKLLSNNDYQVFFFLGDIYTKSSYEIIGNIVPERIHSVEVGNMSETYINLLRESLRVRNLKKKYHIDISISFMEEFNYINILSKGKEKVITRICTILSERKGESIFYERRFVNRLYKKSDRIVIMSDYAKRDLIRNYGLNQKNIRYIFNPSIIHNMANRDEEWKFGDNVVIFVGRFEAVKQPDKIVRAFSAVADNCPDAKLIMLGQGPLADYLVKVSEQFDISDRVVFLGFQENTDFYLENSKVFVMASKTEGFPNGMIEAMAHSLPVISMDSPGAVGEILGKREEKLVNKMEDEDFGVLTPYSKLRMQISDPLSDEERELAKAIVKMLSDNLYRERYIKAALERAHEYDYEKFEKMWIDIIEER